MRLVLSMPLLLEVSAQSLVVQKGLAFFIIAPLGQVAGLPLASMISFDRLKKGHIDIFPAGSPGNGNHRGGKATGSGNDAVYGI